MSILIIYNPELIVIPQSALNYLEENTSKTYILQSNQDIRNSILSGYTNGIRKFILATSSQEIINICDLIEKYDDAMFISPSSTVISLRGKYQNLYFTSASNYYITLVASTNVFGCLVYDNASDPFVSEIIDIFKSYSIPVFDIMDSGWRSYTVLFTVSITQNIWNLINLYNDPNVLYNIFCFEIPTPNNYQPTSNIKGITLISPNPTAQPLPNSYWNYISRIPNFSQTSNTAAILPILIQQSWNLLQGSNIISNTLQINGAIYSRYIPLFNIDIKYNLDNNNLTCCNKYILLVDKSYYSKYTIDNISFLRNIIIEYKITSNISKSVSKYWTKGYRQFILDAPSTEIIAVQRLCLEGLFICTRSGDPTIRHAQSRFLYMVIDDNYMIYDRIQSLYKVTQSNAVSILGHDNNVNIINFKQTLDSLGFNNVPFNRYKTIPISTRLIEIVGNDDEYQECLSYFTENKDKYPQLFSIRRYGNYITEVQSKILKDVGFTIFTVDSNYNSSQPFLDSTYSELSRPTYLFNQIAFYYLGYVLLNFTSLFLFKFGYLIDI